MSANSTALPDVNGGIEGLNTTLNGTTTSPWDFVEDVDFFLLELKLVGSALGIIYLGAHASLRRPPSATPRKSKRPGQKSDDDTQFSQGLEPSDAILFPLLAGALLVGLYYLIQWLKDPAILNKILRWYMSSMSIASVLTLYAHGIELAASFVFPKYWRGRDGRLRRVDQKERSVATCDDTGNVVEGPSSALSPLPGIFGALTYSERARRVAWETRGLFTRHWVLKISAHGFGQEKANIRFSHMMGLLLSLATALVYFSTSSTMLSNLLGYGMCYGSLLLLSPTNFLTGALVLSGLFFYDIFMVFYTPYMVTVATTLDVPIKLTFEAAARKSILGLGDIVIPGMLMGWALRLDLWVFYMRKVKYEATDLKIIEKDAESGALITRSDQKHREVKTPYVNVKGKWGDSLWVRKSWLLSRPQQLPPHLAASRFPKVYFYASMVGYFLGMLVTLAMLVIFKRGQPALLYLVPGVLGSLLLTALVRGEFKELWSYTEDGSLDTRDVVVDLDGSGNPIKTVGKLEDGVVDTTKDEEKEKEKGKVDDKSQVAMMKDGEPKLKKDDSSAKAAATGGHSVFLLSLDAPNEDEADEDDDDDE
ncbi:Intramembrane protease 2 [Paramyrothecium foliicola]|nr:Intramembrane protease 2 [Paramyrothecium foliicola]